MNSDLPIRMPVLFIGHGSPQNAIEENTFTRGWQEIMTDLPQPKAIVCISAHWETAGTAVTAMESPRTIHDFYGFPHELYELNYPAPGDPGLAQRITGLCSGIPLRLDHEWGLDHGCWSVLARLIPQAQIPVVQISLDIHKSPREHYTLGGCLKSLRAAGVLILGSGNIVHNLRLAAVRGTDFNEPFAFEWAREASNRINSLILENRHAELIDYRSLGAAVQKAVPTPEHYLPLLYTLGAKEETDTVTFFNDLPVAGSLTMTCLKISD